LIEQPPTSAALASTCWHEAADWPESAWSTVRFSSVKKPFSWEMRSGALVQVSPMTAYLRFAGVIEMVAAVDPPAVLVGAPREPRRVQPVVSAAMSARVVACLARTILMTLLHAAAA